MFELVLITVVALVVVASLYHSAGPGKSSGVPGDPPQHSGGEEAVSSSSLTGVIFSSFTSISIAEASVVL